MNYKDFLDNFDKRLQGYFTAHKEHICCKERCSSCCEKGDYPISQIELEYIMHGFASLNNDTKIKIQNNIKNIEKGGACPFLINKLCSIYSYRPIICRVHGLAYLCKDETVKVPYCASDGKNYSKVYANGEITINPVLENLDTQNVLKDFEFGEVRNLTDWLK